MTDTSWRPQALLQALLKALLQALPQGSLQAVPPAACEQVDRGGQEAQEGEAQLEDLVHEFEHYMGAEPGRVSAAHVGEE